MKTRAHRRLRWVKKHLGIVALGLTTLALAATNVDTLATLWDKHFGPSEELEAFENAINLPLMPVSNSAVEVELVQSQIDQDGNPTFDVYLRNSSSDDLLLSTVTFGRGVEYLSANLNVSGTFFPASSYTIRAEDRSTRSVALSPPFLLQAHSRAGIRFRFDIDHEPRSGALAPMAFEIYDSSGAKVASVNGLLGDR